MKKEATFLCNINAKFHIAPIFLKILSDPFLIVYNILYVRVHSIIRRWTWYCIHNCIAIIIYKYIQYKNISNNCEIAYSSNFAVLGIRDVVTYT